MEEEFPDGYAIPSYFYDYPAHGNTALNQDFYLSPFLDYDGNGFYDPSSGDYPWYDFLQEIDCKERRRTDQVPLVSVTAISTGSSMIKETFTRSHRASQLVWKCGHRPLHSRPMTRSTT